MCARRIGALLPLVFVAGCSSEPAPRPEDRSIGAPPARLAEAEPDPGSTPPGVDHPIADGQTLWEIARSYDVTVREIMEANDLRPRDVRRLRSGQTLRIPGAAGLVEVADAAQPEELPPVEDGAYHRLGEGETLWDVARMYEVSLDEIMQRNALDDESVRRLRAGRAVIIPGVSAERVAEVAGDRARLLAESRPRGFRHTVSHGETMWDLAGAFGVSVGEIMAANGLDEAAVRELREGTRLWIPGVEQDAGGRVRRRLSARQARAITRARNLGLGTREAAQRLLHGRVERRWTAAASRGGRDRLPGHLRWPITNGWFVRGFGSGEGGYHLAVDIMGRIGWNVRAAARGMVAYSGDGIPGYGNMVLLVHPGGWVTMYAHNSANSVVAGERVPRGGIIAEVGSTGISRGPHVHFELIFDGENCDPALLFRPGILHRDGHLSPLPRVDWRGARERPDPIRCARRRRHPRSRWVSRESYGEDEAGVSDR